MNYLKSVYSTIILLTMLALTGCAGPLSIGYRPGVIPDTSQAKGHPIILLKTYVDLREGVEPHYIGKVTEVVTDMNSDKILLDKEKKEDVATFVTGYITVMSPAGEVVRKIKTPDVFPTNICFGGPDLRTAYITLSGDGKLASMTWPEPGLKLNYYHRKSS